MFLCIDIGNTRTKLAVFSKDGLLLDAHTAQTDEWQDILDTVRKNNISHIITSSTGERNYDVSSIPVSGKIIRLNHDTPLPISIVYKTPETLGRDRIAAACGTLGLFPDRACLIIDAGTCITMDIRLKNGAFAGGNIAPGLSMRLKAMHEYTAKLPLAEKHWTDSSFGESTIQALQNGACLGALMEMEGMINRARDAFGTISVVMTGGDAAFLAEKLESRIFVEPELVVKGLFKILSFNAQ